jgi:periplasmic divalent cation tolerance protein
MHRLIYVTASSVDQAKSIGEKLVEERLAACVNILPNMTSIYRWQGQLEQGAEVVMIAKTRESLVEAATARVRELHPYECPCIVAVPIVAGDAAFLGWIDSETG